MKKKKENKDMILLSNMFAGEYTNNNLAHEIINLYKDDEGKNYIYVQPSGKGVQEGTSTILFVRRIRPGIIEIQAMATGLKKFSEVDKKLEDIKYNGVSIKDIVASDGINITYEAENVVRPKKTIYLSCGEKNEYNHICAKSFLTRKLRKYFYEGTNEFNELKAVLDREFSKDKVLEIKKYVDVEAEILKKEKHFIDIINKNDDELIFSNMFKYYFEKDKENFRLFLKEILKIKSMAKNELDNYVVRREYKHTDITVITKNYHIVIENKIKAQIHGNQLDNYISNARTEEKGTGREIKCFIFKPNYNPIAEQKDYETPINYKTIYEFYEKNRIEDRYFEEFLAALHIHTEETDNHKEEQVVEQFKMIIDEKRNSKK